MLWYLKFLEIAISGQFRVLVVAYVGEAAYTDNACNGMLPSKQRRSRLWVQKLIAQLLLGRSSARVTPRQIDRLAEQDI
jgi:hypothetical protein